MLETSRGKFITIHGIDGTGKTSSTRMVVEGLNALDERAINYDDHKDKLSNPYSEIKKEVDKHGSVEERLSVYLESMMFHSAEIDSLLAQGFHVVKSRYLDDIRAHFSFLGITPEKMKELVEKFPLVQPDLKVILLLEETERRRRINIRGILDDKDLEERKEGSRLDFFENYLREAVKHAPAGSALFIDTGIFNCDEVARKIIDHILYDIET
jgi:thymidylate kinase